jgi:hypothetical protein
MTPSPKTQALEALIEAHATELKLPTVKRRFRQMAAEATREQQTPVAYLAALLEAEMAERAERREKRRLIDARFPIIKRLEEFQFADNPKVPQATIAALADGSWIDDRESVVFVGESGSGKTHLRRRSPCAPATRAAASGSPHSPRSRTSSKKPNHGASSAASSAATPAPSWCALTSLAI